MIHWKRGKVTQLVSCRGHMQIVMVETEQDAPVYPAAHDTSVFRQLRIGDDVLLNVTAAELELGTGGCHFVAALLGDSDNEDDDGAGVDAGELASEGASKGHIMKLRYTPFQRAVAAVEEEGSPFHELCKQELSLDGMPVLIGQLHSMLPAAVSWIRYREERSGRRPLRIAYIMTDGAALPLAWSEHAAVLEKKEWLVATITYGHAYGGKLEAVNKYSALLAARHEARADLSIVTMGPGIVGTGTKYGHTGLEVAEIIQAVAALGGVPVVMPRISFADPRERHRGMSHQLLTALTLTGGSSAYIPVPELDGAEADLIACQWDQPNLSEHRPILVNGVSVQAVSEALGMYPRTITSMGRGLHEDPVFFQAICAAAEWAYARCSQSV